MKSKKGMGIGDIMPIAIAFVVIGIAVAFGLNIIGDVRTSMCSGTVLNNRCYSSYTNTTVYTFGETAQFNASTDAIEGVNKFPAKLGLLVTVIIAAILIGLLVRYLGGAR